jgi:hypothetical protein
MKDIKYHSRKFLNKKAGLAAIECDADFSDYSCYASATISDCNRQITLDFTSYNAKEIAIKITKLGLVINELFELEQFLLEHKYEWTENIKKKELERLANGKKNRVSLIQLDNSDTDSIAG